MFVLISPVVADSFDGARGEGFIAERPLIFRFRLFVDERITVLVRAREIVRRGITAHVAVYTLRVNVIHAENIFPDAIIRISHKNSDK